MALRFRIHKLLGDFNQKEHFGKIVLQTLQK